ncbi:NADH oxidase [Oxobacter pfennigii]|uniref:NADH oxidase n=1 Tax=Oxobacter pfennigii TaxID=36849 RepID=A0A0N8NSW7_9CLOT|nr:hypothetical protein [Oxobacter pfennigii]KPU43184.1 NADH oxidase [Oxobacter pfennigii]
MKYPNLFKPIKIRGMELKNRVIFPAMGTGFLKNGYVTDRLIDYHVTRAIGGTALIGYALKARKAINAIEEAAEVAREI